MVLFSVSANEYKFGEIKIDHSEKEQKIYQPKNKLDEYIIKGVTYSTKFVPLMNNGAEVSEFMGIMAKDLNRLLVDIGINIEYGIFQKNIIKLITKFLLI